MKTDNKAIDRRNFLKLGAASAALVATGQGVLEAKEIKTSFKKGNKDFSVKGERKMIPTSCWSCVTRDSMVGYIEDGRLVKLEGQVHSQRGRGKICAKGQAGINQVYDPDRILYPMLRTGKRGEGKWKKLSWKEALKVLVDGYERDGKHVKGLKEIRADNPAKFMFHYGRMKASSSKIIKGSFLTAYGTKTIGNHTSICEGGKWSSQELTWGGHYDNWDADHTQFMLNFGSNIFETHTNHIPVAQRIADAMSNRGVRMVTFDVRLSNTAARSSEWVPVKPGSDCAILLSMCNVVMENNLYDRDFIKFMKVTNQAQNTVDEKIAALKSHFAKYTPEWASKISGVPASKIVSLTKEFATTKPACLITYRGAIAHYNGNEAERAAQTLAGITGNIDNPGGRCKGVGSGWSYPKPKNPPKGKGLKIVDGHPEKGHKGYAAFPTHHMSHWVFKMIKDYGKEFGRPDLYMWYCYNPVYVNGECQENIDVLKDEKLLPFTVAIDPFYSESTSLADLILPDATYLERWDWEDMVSPTQIGEHYIRQPLIKPLGESRDFGDVVCDLAKMMNLDIGGVTSKEDFVKKSCHKTKEVVEAAKKVGEDPFEYMKKRGGVWHDDPSAKLDKPAPGYYRYKIEISAEETRKDGVIFDQKTGVYWNWHKSKANSAEEARSKGYTKTKKAYKGYVAQKIGDKLYKGFNPDAVNKSGYLEIYSDLLELKGENPMPTYMEIPEHKNKKADELMLTTYKVNVHTHSRTANCKWLTEIYHENPAWINSKTAAEKGIKHGDMIKLTNPNVKSDGVITKAHVTESITPGVIAISYHLGHWQYGRTASGKNHSEIDSKVISDADVNDRRWWAKGRQKTNDGKWVDGFGAHPNWLIANSPDPLNGQQRWMDSVVKVEKV